MAFSWSKFAKGLNVVSGAGIAVLSAIAQSTGNKKVDALSRQFQGIATAFIPNDPGGEITVRSIAAAAIKEILLRDATFLKKSGLTEFESISVFAAMLNRIDPQSVDTPEELQSLTESISKAYSGV